MKRLRELRMQNGMSQKEFADIFHASQNTISQWENGTRKPSYEVAEEIASFFGVSVDYLLGNTDEPRTLDQQLEGIDFALFGEVHELTDEEKQDVINFAKFIKSQRKNAENND